MGIYENITVETSNNIIVVSINRPKALNALNKGVFDDLIDFFEKAKSDDSIKGIVITGTGAKSFVAGADIKEFLGLDSEKAEAMTRRVHNLFFTIERFSKPVIAAVNGFALGGGCELAMSCHIRVAGEGARFGQPEVNLGILPGYGGTQRLVQLVGKGKALELMMTSDMVKAEEAKSLGLANHVVPGGEEVNKAIEIIDKISTKSPLAIAAVISTVNAYFDKDKNGFEEEIIAFSKLSVTEDFKEGASAFIEKRKPEWKGI